MGLIEDLRYLVRVLSEERGSAVNEAELARMDEAELFSRFRALVNTRDPLPASEAFLAVQDRVLRGMIEEAGIIQASALPRCTLDERISLWRGDITTLAADAIVNAANSQMLGCWVPGHFCIDNAIHTFAGVQLRAECDRIMREQGFPEPTGMAKVTPAYDLPSKWVIHTVGPIAQGTPTKVDRALLANCYRSCLDAAVEYGCDSVAFCCISTGVFGFPQAEAARIAIETVRSWLNECDSDLHVVFNVFSERDEELYHALLFS